MSMRERALNLRDTAEIPRGECHDVCDILSAGFGKKRKNKGRKGFLYTEKSPILKVKMAMDQLHHEHGNEGHVKMIYQNIHYAFLGFSDVALLLGDECKNPDKHHSLLLSNRLAFQKIDK